MILFLSLLFMTVASLTDVEVEKHWAKTFRKSDVRSTQLMVNIQRMFMEYECSREDADCSAWKAVLMINALAIGKVNCDEEDISGMCGEAKVFLETAEDKELSHEEIMTGLLAAHGKLYDEEHIKYLNAIFKALADYVCFKDNHECVNFRYLQLSCDIAYLKQA